MSYQIGVIGSSDKRPIRAQEAEIVGRKLAEEDCTLFTGGCMGIPNLAAEAAKVEAVGDEAYLVVGFAPELFSP